MLIDADIIKTMMWEMACHGFSKEDREEKETELKTIMKELEFLNDPLKYYTTIQEQKVIRNDDIQIVKTFKKYLTTEKVNGK